MRRRGGGGGEGREKGSGKREDAKSEIHLEIDTRANTHISALQHGDSRRNF